jgi:CRISPR/Cas system CMR-associated protein Cmr1 (group 7 of RAMP superfamily)
MTILAKTINKLKNENTRKDQKSWRLNSKQARHFITFTGHWVLVTTVQSSIGPSFIVIMCYAHLFNVTHKWQVSCLTLTKRKTSYWNETDKVCHINRAQMRSRRKKKELLEQLEAELELVTQENTELLIQTEETRKKLETLKAKVL